MLRRLLASVRSGVVKTFRCTALVFRDSNMKHPWNPSNAELREWAFDADSEIPHTDFDLALTWLGDERLYFSLAADDSCPKRRFFLSLLYFMVGHAVRTRFRDWPRPIIDGMVANGDNYSHADIRTWQQRSRELLANPDAFDYDDWCSGRLANA